jgi:hypothetical protein
MNKNILGLGQATTNTFMWDKRKQPGTGYKGIYVIPNILGSFFTGNITYNTSFGSQLLRINLNRSFFTPNIKYAGGFSFTNVKTDFFYLSAIPPRFYPIEYNHYESWLGRSFRLSKENILKTRQNLTLAGKIINDRYYQRPLVTENSYYALQNKTLTLFSLSYTQQNFFESNLIYNFGRTEDIPVGIKMGATVGFEKNEFFKRSYFDSELSAGKFLGTYGYLYSGILYSSFFNKGQAEQGLLNANINYFSNLYVIKRYSFRQFLTLNMTNGINRFEREFITVNDKLGISGYKNDSIYGSKRFTIKFETVCFTPWELLDFKFVFFLFADRSWLAKQNENIFDNAAYNGYGFGFRLRNNRLVFNTVQIRFAFYPHIPANSITSWYKISGEPILTTPDFSPKIPDLPTFQ